MNVLAIGAHFDDVELGCGGAIAKHVENGDNVTILVVTHSAYEHFDGSLVRDKETALGEGQKAANILGARLLCWNWETKHVEYSTELIEKLNKLINDLKIDTVYTHWVHDVHQDHAAIAKATLNAARHVPRVLMYRSNWYSTTSPFIGRFYIDVSSTIGKKIDAIKAHDSEYKKFGQRWVDFVVHQNRNSGIEMEVEYAETFDIVKYVL